MNDCVAACKCPGQWQYIVSCCLLLFHQQKGPPPFIFLVWKPLTLLIGNLSWPIMLRYRVLLLLVCKLTFLGSSVRHDAAACHSSCMLHSLTVLLLCVSLADNSPDDEAAAGGTHEGLADAEVQHQHAREQGGRSHLQEGNLEGPRPLSPSVPLPLLLSKS